ncbi:M14 family metallopeptidase [Candidatus Pacebacteria bacterium]|nr:M14 family metallopeptidase [Candidatus Paceibacterota bacterium]
MKYFLIALGVLILVAGGAFLFMNQDDDTALDVTPSEPQVAPPSDQTNIVIDGDDTDDDETDEDEPMEVIGSSVDGNDITAYHFGTGESEVLFVGGVHGGYSFNTSLLGYELIDYLEDTPEAIPDGVKVTVIPVLNPDGLDAVVGSTGRFDAADADASEDTRIAGRFNANEVDLNRNFDCEWNETGTWQSRDVSGGSAPFSEPEAAALRDYVSANDIAAAVVYYSQAGGVYSATCDGEVSPEVATLTNLYANAAGYDAFEEFDYYEITGDMVNWLTSTDVPAISVLLTDHESPEWSKNRVGIEAVLEYFGE